MNKAITEENNITIQKAQSGGNLFKTYLEIANKYFEDLASACSFGNEFFKYLVKNRVFCFIDFILQELKSNVPDNIFCLESISFLGVGKRSRNSK